MTIRRSFGITAHHILENLATDMYKDFGQCVGELLRNGAVASQISPDPEVWEPKRAHLEIDLVPNHPLTPRGTSAFQGLDHGSGLTDVGVVRFLSLGRQISQMKKGSRSSHGGAAQKGIGRISALGLNERCLPVMNEDDDAWLERIKHGFYVLSRTSDSGPVRYFRFTPEDVELDQIHADNFISPNATEMGPLKDIRGSFTAIIIPTPVFKTHEEIYEAVKWRLPRESDKMYRLFIGGKAYEPPPLEQRLNLYSEDHSMRACIGPHKPIGDENVDGIWLCDSKTGLRIVSCAALGHTKLSAPFWFPELKGEIFCPGLLANQDTARGGLTKQFLDPKRKNSQWNRLYMWLIREVAGKAEELLSRDPVETDAEKALDELVDLFHKVYGEPEGSHREKNPNPNPGPRPSPGPKPDPVKEKQKRSRRHAMLKVRDKEYVIYKGLTLPEFVFAEVDTSNELRINVNVRGRGYKALPRNRDAKNEHMLMHMLFAIGRSNYPDVQSKAIEFANMVRAEMMPSKPKAAKKME